MGDHASIDINCLATSLRGKFGTLHPSSEDCCIYRVSPKIRRSNENLCTPKAVSIGPLHHNREELKAMEEHKLRYLRQFLQRTLISLEDFLASIKDKETSLRDCYAETIELGSQEFNEMMLLDAIFLIEFLLRSSKHDLVTSDDRLFKKPWLSKDILADIWSVENQIPFFILENLFLLAKTSLTPENQWCYEGVSMSELVSDFCSGCGLLSIGRSLFETNFSAAKHFLDLLRLCVEPPDNVQVGDGNESSVQVGDGSESSVQVGDGSESSVQVGDGSESSVFPTISATIRELHQAGIKLRAGSCQHLFDISFDGKTLEIPKLRMNYSFCIKHLQIFEGLHCETNHMNDYAVFLSCLVTSPEDAELLIQNGIIENSEKVEASQFFKKLPQNASVRNYEFKYSRLARDLEAHCKLPWNKWNANLKQNYFNTPWVSISVIAAVVLLILTFIQSVCSVLAL